MTARDTRAGGRHLAVERGAVEPAPEPTTAESPSTAPLREFLSERSRQAILEILARLEGRAAA